MDSIDLGFPIWIRVSHLFNILFITLLIRKRDRDPRCPPQTVPEGRLHTGHRVDTVHPRQMLEDRFWTGKDEQEAYSSWVSLPGRQAPGPRPPVAFSGGTGVDPARG